ncbi:ATP-grasp domain-containing protein [Algibacter mikhailovii]|uniref:Carbamoyl phosphate synthase large subunit n=1 Tax=Algibacter mikhailovii TaxID=425498 RepID=A0A918QRC4_9FLAO|nr:ATP-grasp domain-containing protein [Algibacter mikhailovii]GGZ68882.1 carbamoyl phosphate synthase large subunit [Algibacter mikhailovii]
MKNILISSAGRRVSLVKSFQKELSKIDASSKVYACDSEPFLSSAVQIADSFFRTLCFSDKDYIDDLLKKCKKHEIVLIIPTLDTELDLFAKNRDLFLQNGITIVVSDESFIKIGEDKIKTAEFFNNHNLATPKVYEKDNYKLPFFIKPLRGSNSIDNYIVKKQKDIINYFFENESLCFFEYLDHDFHDEYTCDLYYSKKGILKCVIPRKRIEVRGGEVSKGITKRNKINEFLKSNFAQIDGARGCITVQIFMNIKTNDLFGIEINPRFGGGYPLSYLAGGNYTKWVIEEYIYNKEINFCNSWKENLLMLRYDNEVLVHNYEE